MSEAFSFSLPTQIPMPAAPISPPSPGPALGSAEPAAAETNPRHAALIDAPSPVGVVRALAGFTLAGLVSGPLGGTTTLLAGLLAPSGALLLTVPALLVVHQYLGLRAPPRALVHVIARAFCRSGDLALALAPTLLLFATTSELGPVLFALTLFGNGAFTLLGTVLDLHAAEGRHNEQLAQRAQMFFLAVSWAGLAALIALRISLSNLL